MRQLAAGLLQVLQQHQPHRRHRGGEADFVGGEQLVDRGAIHLGARQHQRGADHGRREGERPAIGVEHRHHRQADIARLQILGIRQRRHQRVQHVGAVRVDDALRVAGRARRVAHAGGGVLVELAPFEVAVFVRDPVLVGDRVLQRGLRHVRGVGEDDVALDQRQLVGDFFQQRHESEVGDHHAVAGMIDDPHDLVGEQPRIDGVIDRADAEDAVPGLQVTPGVPGQRRHPVAELDAVLFQPLRHFLGALADLGVIGLDDRPLDRARNDLALAVIFGGMVDDAMEQQRPVLHQAEHGIPLLFSGAWSCPKTGTHFSGPCATFIGPAPLAGRV